MIPQERASIRRERSFFFSAGGGGTHGLCLVGCVVNVLAKNPALVVTDRSQQY